MGSEDATEGIGRRLHELGLGVVELEEPDEAERYFSKGAGERRSLVFGDMANGNMDLHLLDLETGERMPWLATSTTEAATRFSPDGKWVVFASSQTGERRVVLRSFPDGDIASPVSSGPGDMPVWVGDEIFYETPEHIMSVRVTIGEDGYPVFGEPVVEVSSLNIRDFDVSPDGTTLLLNRLLGWQRGGTIRLVQNWAP